MNTAAMNDYASTRPARVVIAPFRDAPLHQVRFKGDFQCSQDSVEFFFGEQLNSATTATVMRERP